MAFAILGTPKPQFFDSSGSPLAGGTLAVLEPSDESNKASYPTADDADAQTNANANPLTLDSRGEPSAGLFGRDGETYRLVLRDSSGNTIWTADDIQVPSATQATIGQALYPRTADEISAGVTPSNYSYPAGNVLRYGADSTGAGSSSTAISNAISANDSIYIPDGTYTLTSTLSITADQEIIGQSSSNTIISASGITGSVIDIDPGTGGAAIRHLKIHNLRFQVASGTPNNFIHVVANATYVSTGLNFEDLHFDSTGGNIDRAHVEITHCWDSVFRRFSHRGTATIAAVYLHSELSSGSVNGIMLQDIYTGMTSTPYGILAARDSGAPVLTALQVLNATVQGHTDAGVMICDTYGCVVQNTYGEDNDTDVQFGDYNKTTIDGLQTTRSVHSGTIIGGFHNVDASDTAIRLDSGSNHLVINPTMLVNSGNWYDIGRVGGVHIQTGGDISNGELLDNIAFNASAHTTTEVLVTHFGRADGALQLQTDPYQFILNNDGNAYPLDANGTTTFADADATPSVAGGGKVFITANTGATTITDFDDGRAGQEIVVIINDGNTTIDFYQFRTARQCGCRLVARRWRPHDLCVRRY